MRAVVEFDPHVGVRFSTYASYWIRQPIRVELNRSGHVVRVPQYISTLLAKWRRTNALLRDELGVEPTREQIAAKLGITNWHLQMVHKAQKATALTRGGSEDVDFSETISDDRALPPDYQLPCEEELASDR